MVCRSLERAEEAKVDIEKSCKGLSGTGVIVIAKCDLTSMKSIRECAQNILDTEPQINILVNNAGMMTSHKTETEDGFETQFGTNHLAHFLLTMLLLPRIRNSTPARIVTVSSAAHKGYGIHLDDLNYKKRPYKTMEAYSQSKIANIMFSSELAAKLKEHNIEGVNTYSLHPGMIKTEFGRNLDLFWGVKNTIGFVLAPFMKTLDEGAQTTIYCSVDEKCANETGLYYSDCAPERPAAKATNEEHAKKLWELSVEMVRLGDFNPFTANDPGIKTK